MIGQVERFDADLQLPPFVDGNVFKDAAVQPVKRRPAEEVSAQAAVPNPSGIPGRVNEQGVRRGHAERVIAGRRVGGGLAYIPAADQVVIFKYPVRRVGVRVGGAGTAANIVGMVVVDAIQVVVAADVLQEAVRV